MSAWDTLLLELDREVILSVAVAIIAAMPGLLVGLAMLKKADAIHTTFNSKMDRLLNLTAEKSWREGKEEGKKEQRRSSEGK